MNAEKNTEKHTEPGLIRYLSPLGVWALAFGCSVGWGAFVMPGTTFLPIAGPWGTAIGIALGAVLMLIIGVNYHYMMCRYPDAGGAFTYVKSAFGYDHGFLSAWFLVLTYIAIIWANDTALALIGRNLLGNLFQVGFLYQIAGYDIYLGEVALSVIVLVLCGVICIFRKRLAGWLQIVLAVVLLGGIIACFLAALNARGGDLSGLTPAFSPEGNPLAQLFHIVALTPWAFVGFESISHSAAEFRFPPKRTFRILFSALVAGALSYILLTLLAAMIPPEGYAGWSEYIGDLGNLSGLEGLPTFHAANAAMGRTGLVILDVTVTAGILTGLIGNLIATSRLLYSMAEDGILPRRFRKLDRSGTPRTAILFLILISAVIPFLGRTAVGWIVDVTTIGATIAYGYTSATALRTARRDGNRRIQITGVIGIVVSVVFMLYFLVPNFWSVGVFATESYLILIAWSILGFFFFRLVFRKDRKRRFAKSTVAWIALLFLVFFSSLMWMRQASHSNTQSVVNNISVHYTQELEEHGLQRDREELRETEEFLSDQMEDVSASLSRNNLIQMGLIVLALAIMLNIYTHMSDREKQMEIEKVRAEDNNRAKSTFLSNLSHDIRTPMNAIIGYTTLARQEPDLPPKVRTYLEKIDHSNQHLLALINDVLEMSRIESGKLDLELAPTNLKKTLTGVHDMFLNQMEAKRITYTVDAEQVSDPWVLCDENRMNRVLLNLISNACKFTPEGGSVTVTLKETGKKDGSASFELRVRDTGIGMSPEFAARVFEAFEREKTKTVSEIQGTGLGMSITKSLLDLMGGEIDVRSKQGEGTEFLIRLTFLLAPEPEAAGAEGAAADVDLSGKRILLAEDNEINREIATMILQGMGLQVIPAADGKDAVEKMTAAAPGEYDAVLMDIQMPVMNGYEAARAIRALRRQDVRDLPILALSANAREEDRRASLESGMNDHIAKPFQPAMLVQTVSDYIAARPEPEQA